MYISAVKNLFLAELLTNFHGFLAIVTNHAGNDMYRFRDSCRPYSGSFYLRQVLASVDFWTGSDINDFLHGYLNYQIEHHLWPSLSMLSYKRSQPLVKALCKKHGVPYVQENVFLRLKKTIDIMTGASSMRWFPEDYEKKFIERDAILENAKKEKLLSDKCMEAVVE
jgi:fatty acid desaturase